MTTKNYSLIAFDKESNSFVTVVQFILASGELRDFNTYFKSKDVLDCLRVKQLEDFWEELTDRYIPTNPELFEWDAGNGIITEENFETVVLNVENDNELDIISMLGLHDNENSSSFVLTNDNSMIMKCAKNKYELQSLGNYVFYFPTTNSNIVNANVISDSQIENILISI